MAARAAKLVLLANTEEDEEALEHIVRLGDLAPLTHMIGESRGVLAALPELRPA